MNDSLLPGRKFVVIASRRRRQLFGLARVEGRVVCPLPLFVVSTARGRGKEASCVRVHAGLWIQTFYFLLGLGTGKIPPSFRRSVVGVS